MSCLEHCTVCTYYCVVLAACYPAAAWRNTLEVWVFPWPGCWIWEAPTPAVFASPHTVAAMLGRRCCVCQVGRSRVSTQSRLSRHTSSGAVSRGHSQVGTFIGGQWCWMPYSPYPRAWRSAFGVHHAGPVGYPSPVRQAKPSLDCRWTTFLCWGG